MKALVNTAPGRLEWQDRPMPEPGPGEVRIRCAAVGICATDLEMIAGWERTGFPAVPGHEWIGTVDRAGPGVDAGLVGRRCAAENILADGGEVGFEHPGAYGQYFLTLSSSLHLLPDDFPLRRGVLIEPLAVGMRCLKRLRLQDRSSALIIGDGPVGLLMLLLLRQAGVRELIQIGGRSGRLALARELGASVTFDHRQAGESLMEQVRQAVPGGFANVVEVSGSGSGARAAVELAGRGAHVAILGSYGQQRADFQWNSILHKEIELVGSNASAGGWEEAVRFTLEDGLELERVVSHVFPIRDYQAAFDLVRGEGEDVVKVMLDWTTLADH